MSLVVKTVSEAGAKANAICLSLAETAKANGIDFYQYLVKLMTELPNIPFQQQLAEIEAARTDMGEDDPKAQRLIEKFKTAKSLHQRRPFNT